MKAKTGTAPEPTISELPVLCRHCGGDRTPADDSLCSACGRCTGCGHSPLCSALNAGA
jgi:hypothetical protein